MHFFDIFIIYLTCGAPISVFYFFQTQKDKITLASYAKTILTFLFWIPFLIHLINTKLSRKLFTKKNEIENKTFDFQKHLENILIINDLPISIFEFRELFNRYVGLTMAANSETEIDCYKQDFFQIAGSINPKIGAVCLARKNFQKLSFHQKQARHEFICLTNLLFGCVKDRNHFLRTATIFFTTLKDSEALLILEKRELIKNVETETGNLINELNFQNQDEFFQTQKIVGQITN